MRSINSVGKRQPPPVIILPTLRWRPLLVRGIPVALEMRCLVRVTPVSRFQEKPPLFGMVCSSGFYLNGKSLAIDIIYCNDKVPCARFCFGANDPSPIASSFIVGVGAAQAFSCGPAPAGKDVLQVA